MPVLSAPTGVPRSQETTPPYGVPAGPAEPSAEPYAEPCAEQFGNEKESSLLSTCWFGSFLSS